MNRHHGARMDEHFPQTRVWLRVLILVAIVGPAVLLATYGNASAAATGITLASVYAISALVLARAGRDWPARRSLVAAEALAGAAIAASALSDLDGEAFYGASPWDVIFLGLLVPFALALRAEFRMHFEAHDRREIALDTVLMAAALGVLCYLVILPTDASGRSAVSAAVFALTAASLITGTASLAIWVPTRGHIGLALACLPLGLATLGLGRAWSADSSPVAMLWLSLAIATTPIAVSWLLLAVPHAAPKGSGSRLLRPAQAAASIATATAAMVVVAIMDDAAGIVGAGSAVLLVGLGLGLFIRVLANQRSSTEDHERVQEALERRGTALGEADRALERVREAHEVLRRSEEHLRLVFEAAEDGFVEIGADGRIERANDAFCVMVRVDRAHVEGSTWSDLAARLDGADEGFAHLPSGGTATIARPDGPPMHLESRASKVPTDPPRRLLLIRDVTSAKVADQTIRSLFQFLQDRDEDRTRLLRRTNAAIEQERNRVARDLHDGPVQGVSAASLSLEAALLMIKAGEVEGGTALLAHIREELAGEADALRRLMANLRPPVLEERGLMPALRDSLARFGIETGVVTEFSGRLTRSIPDDLETLAFRVVQEALHNVARHAEATSVTVHVQTDATQLRIEIEDDGRGFDTAGSREFLRSGRVGLASMRERVELASGTFAVRSTLGRGTAVMAAVPLDTALVAAGG